MHNPGFFYCALGGSHIGDLVVLDYGKFSLVCLVRNWSAFFMCYKSLFRWFLAVECFKDVPWRAYGYQHQSYNDIHHCCPLIDWLCFFLDTEAALLVLYQPSLSAFVQALDCCRVISSTRLSLEVCPLNHVITF